MPILCKVFATVFCKFNDACISPHLRSFGTVPDNTLQKPTLPGCAMGIAILHQIDAQLVKGSFRQVFARKAALTDKFYEYLFLEMPDTRAMFTGDFSHQKEMFASVLAAGVRSLGQDAELLALIDRLLLRHRHLGLTSGHMYMAQRALLLAFREVMGPHLTAAEASAWGAAIRRLCQTLAAGIDTPAT
ncbi:globin domain-containing protein [Tritonibacter mobilis]|uniref:globin domain-containing protein n=1 Tax=Tritonibacter mobilis TaxID=379347 RepID=UPI001D0D382D|nr:globin domain-containing protein [Tritonibacter mobilis]